MQMKRNYVHYLVLGLKLSLPPLTVGEPLVVGDPKTKTFLSTLPPPLTVGEPLVLEDKGFNDS